MAFGVAMQEVNRQAGGGRGTVEGLQAIEVVQRDEIALVELIGRHVGEADGELGDGRVEAAIAGGGAAGMAVEAGDLVFPMTGQGQFAQGRAGRIVRALGIEGLGEAYLLGGGIDVERETRLAVEGVVGDAISGAGRLGRRGGQGRLGEGRGEERSGGVQGILVGHGGHP